jgi:transposase-like protein
MIKKCPNPSCVCPDSFSRDGFFRRREDSKLIQRFRCNSCGKRFSSATFSDLYRQRRRRINGPLAELLSSNVSQRRAAILLGVNRRTVERRIPFLGRKFRRLNDLLLRRRSGKIYNIQLDDLITKENSKLKPLAVTVIVDENSRRILALEVSQIPAFGHLAEIARRKYGPRRDEHEQGLTAALRKIAAVVSPDVRVRSDEHRRYPFFLARYLPRSRHETFPSERSCVAGQGELKKVKFDPLFAVNHTCAMLRGNINRLIRKTWCTTKDPRRLKDHLEIFMYYYNEVLLAQKTSPIR